MSDGKDPSDSDGVQEHGPETVCYTGGPGEPYYRPTITCICGWYSGRGDSWAVVGELFDEHLEEVKGP